MSTEPQKLTDVSRILLGRVPWTFTIEVVVRIVFVYAVLVVAMRLMGKRMSATMTRNELAALVSLAGAVGPALQDPKNGLVPALIVVVVVVGIQRLVAKLSKDHGAFERVTQGSPTNVVTGGRMDMRALKHITLSRQRVIAHLRAEGITNLGQVERVYFEIDGSFTVVRAAHARPGLSLLPAFDEELRRAQPHCKDQFVCSTCGAALPDDGSRCACGDCRRELAVAA